MATLRQIHANQLNSLKSTGPTSPEGKEASRANALKHGLSGAGIVLPDEEKAEIVERLAQWNSSLRPYDNVDGYFAELVATEAVRVERCRTMELSLREESARRAGENWDHDRRLAAAKLAARLSKRPEVVALELANTSQGIDLLLERWRTLASVLETGDWTDAQRSRALDLLGVAHEDREATDPLILATRPGGLGLAGLVAQQIEKLNALKPILDVRDGREQASAMLGLGATSDAINRIQRYEGACMRRLQWAYTRLKSVPVEYRSPHHPILPASKSTSNSPTLVKGRLADSYREPTAYEEVLAYQASQASRVETLDSSLPITPEPVYAWSRE